MPHNKSCKKRLKVSAKASLRNRVVRSSIRTSLKLVRSAKSKEEVLKEMPSLFSMLDKAAAKGRAGFSKNRASNYKRKIAALLTTFDK